MEASSASRHEEQHQVVVVPTVSAPLPVVLLVRLTQEMARAVEGGRAGSCVGSLRLTSSGSGELALTGQESCDAAVVDDAGRVECYRGNVEVGRVAGRLLVTPRVLGESARAEVREKIDRARELATARQTKSADPKPAKKISVAREQVAVPAAPVEKKEREEETLVFVRGLLDWTGRRIRDLFEGMEPSRTGLIRIPREHIWTEERSLDLFDAAFVVFRSKPLAQAAAKRAMLRKQGIVVEIGHMKYEALGIACDDLDLPLESVMNDFRASLLPFDPTNLLGQIAATTEEIDTPVGHELTLACRCVEKWREGLVAAERKQLSLEIRSEAPRDPRAKPEQAVAFLSNLRTSLIAQLDTTITLLSNSGSLSKDYMKSGKLGNFFATHCERSLPCDDLFAPFSAADDDDERRFFS